MQVSDRFISFSQWMLQQTCSRRETPKADAKRSALCPIVSFVENSAIAGNYHQGIMLRLVNCEKIRNKLWLRFLQHHKNFIDKLNDL